MTGADGGEETVRLAYDTISEARLVLTDALIAAALKEQAALDGDPTT